MKTIHSRARAILGALAAMTLAASALAAPITYGVNQAIGAGSVTGTITTDGTLGTLSQADITGWSLLLSDGTNTFSLKSGSSAVYLQGSDVTADASHVYFDFSGADSGVLAFQQNLFSGSHYYCNATQAASFYCAPGESVVPTDVFSNPNFPRQALSGVQVIASAAPVPEPASLVLMAGGVLALALRRRQAPR